MVEIPVAAAAPHLDRQEEHADHVVLHPKPRLREKALVNVPNAAPTDDADMIARAQRAVEALAPSFAEWMSSGAANLLEALDRFEASDRGPEAMAAMRQSAQNIRGQAKQFGYPIVAQIAGGLSEHLEAETLDVPVVVVRRYVEAVASIIRAGVKDAANETALALARHLVVLSNECRARLKAPAETHSIPSQAAPVSRTSGDPS